MNGNLIGKKRQKEFQQEEFLFNETKQNGGYVRFSFKH